MIPRIALHQQRRASRLATTAFPLLFRPLHHPRPVSTTPALAQALAAAKTSPEEPRTAQKKAKKEKRGPSAAKGRSEEEAKNRIEKLIIKALDAPPGKAPPASAEEMERRYHVGRNYVIGRFKQHNEWNHDLACKIRMKKHAMRMLPREGELGDVEENGESVYGKWKREAVKLNDFWGPPDHRLIPMHTPPIEGFDPTIYMDQEEEEN